MCITNFSTRKCKMASRDKIGLAVRGVVTQAKKERRLICGLLPAIAYLEQKPDEALLCLLPITRPGDAAKHMQTVLLQAFCYENYIPVIQVDNSERLADICGVPPNRKGSQAECLCAIITQNVTNTLDENEYPQLSPAEQELTDFYECTLEEYPRPVIQLPI